MQSQSDCTNHMTNLKLFNLLLIEIIEDHENLNDLEELSHSLLIYLSQFVATTDNTNPYSLPSLKKSKKQQWQAENAVRVMYANCAVQARLTSDPQNSSQAVTSRSHNEFKQSLLKQTQIFNQAATGGGFD